MFRKYILVTIVFALTFVCFGQSFHNNIKKNLVIPTSYDTYVSFLNEVSGSSDIINLGWMAKSYDGRQIPYVVISLKEISNSDNVKFLIFASQHGNEPSGKEALLLLVKEIWEGKHIDLLKNVDLIIVPQVNPDGGEKGHRLSANNSDLNRTHLNLKETETEGLHRLFYKYLPHATLDIHETYFHNSNWYEYGFIKTYDQQMGVLNNPNIDQSIIDFQNNVSLQEVGKFVEQNGFSFHNYILGNVYKGQPIRHSNTGIYDGRQSFGILNTLSFIVEGENGKILYDRLNERRDGQYYNILGLLKHISQHSGEIKTLVDNARQKLLNAHEGETVSIRSEYKLGKETIDILLHDLIKKKDTLINYPYESEVVSTLNVKKPKGYLIEKNDFDLLRLLDKHNIKFSPYFSIDDEIVYQYCMTKNETEVDGDRYFSVKKNEVTGEINKVDYYFIPTKQLASNLIVNIFEPQSSQGVDSKYGILENRRLNYFLNSRGEFSILRVESK